MQWIKIIFSLNNIIITINYFMKIINRYILREHLVPFIISLVILLLVLLANFLIKSIDKFLGKGLDIGLLFEFVLLNMAWILALAVPMAILVSTLMAFGRLSSDNEITAMKACGTSFIRLLIPAGLFGIAATILMILFNNYYLPDMNHKARLLSSDFSRTNPEVLFDTGYFIDQLPGNVIFIGGKKENNLFTDIIIFNKSSDVQKRTITANEGTIKKLDDGYLLNLFNGTIHELSKNISKKKSNEYRIIDYQTYDIVIPMENMILSRNNTTIRGDREMNFTMMNQKINNLKSQLKTVEDRVNNRLMKEIKIDKQFDILSKEKILSTIQAFKKTTLDSLKKNNFGLLSSFNRRMQNLERGINTDFSLMNSYQKSINSYRVELHKKFSIPFACIIFIIIGAPLGIISRRGGLGMSISISLLFFIIYWAFLIGGEELADRGLLHPGLSMWLPNIILGLVGLYLCYIVSVEKTIINMKK